MNDPSRTGELSTYRLSTDSFMYSVGHNLLLATIVAAAALGFDVRSFLNWRTFDLSIVNRQLQVFLRP